jgi:thiamine-monophosphate kinase
LRLVSAALDVSDGLIADLGHIAQTSKVRVVVESPRLPLSSALAALWGKDQHAILRAATSGDDYELAFTAPKTARARIVKAAKQAGVTVKEIGWVEQGSGVVLLDAKGVSISVARSGFTHF